MIGTILFGSASLICTSYVLAIGVPLISWTDALSIALQVSLVISLLNITVKPILKVISIPFNLLTFGFFSFVINGVVIFLAGEIIRDFVIPSFLSAVLFATLFTFLMRIYHLLASDED